jgi:hypothetical protein
VSSLLAPEPIAENQLLSAAAASFHVGRQTRSTGDRAEADRRGTAHRGGHAGPAGLCLEARWLRFARTGLAHLFPYLPRQSGYNKRLRAARAQVIYFIRALAQDTDLMLL